MLGFLRSTMIVAAVNFASTRNRFGFGYVNTTVGAGQHARQFRIRAARFARDACTQCAFEKRHGNPDGQEDDDKANELSHGSYLKLGKCERPHSTGA